ncbi:MAG: LacI family DNA-binding transcriptional regulator [Acidimicrobiaceae bacterium]|nr:LacI family DNA-binding transcriptional regulator [Acidimicrobiaceae bacterium]MDE0495901.1 LacI family DNA-binding transcriptional regulator [Acidimicrobiaceae bacterium]
MAGGTEAPDSGARPATSTDVAIEAGVSQATVARTFSAPHLVSERTRERVSAAAERLGYAPNAFARSLKSQQSNVVGAVVPAYGEYWQNVLSAVTRELAVRGRQLLLFSFTDPGEVDDVLDIVRQYRVSGLLLASASIRPDQLSAMRRQSSPTVAFNQPAASGLVSSVSVDNEAGCRLLASHLVDQGCRTAVFVGGVSSVSTDQARYRGAAREMGDHGVALPYIEAGAFSYDAGYACAERIARLAPDAVMVGSDEVAFGVIDGLESRGVRIPDDMAVTGFDGLPQASWAGIDLTTLVQPTDLLAQHAAELLVDTTSVSRPTDVVVDGHLRIGRTTKRSER